MTNTPTEGENIVAYRLGEVEKTVKETNSKLDGLLEIRNDIAINSLKIANLEKSRDRLITVISLLGTGVVMLFLEQMLNLF